MILSDPYMHRCLQLAASAAGNVAPNPMVGALLLHDEIIIGEGYHKKYGQAHAEVECINSVSASDKHLISEATMYVSLEPCAHFGKTPPCADLIIKNKIRKVVIGCRDPFTEVNGKGIAKLEAAGIEVIKDVLKDECIELNKRFFTFHQKQRPYIILKWAQTADGKISGETEQRLKISNEFSNRLVHKWRAEEAAIMAGTNTALMDNPSLATRLWAGNNPVRVILDLNLRLPQNLEVFTDGGKTIVINKQKNENAGPVSYIKIEAGDLAASICTALYKLNIQSVMIEGGSRLLQTFIDAGYWDEARLISNISLFAGNGLTAPALKNAHLIKEQRFQNDLVSFYTKNQE